MLKFVKFPNLFFHLFSDHDVNQFLFKPKKCQLVVYCACAMVKGKNNLVNYKVFKVHLLILNNTSFLDFNNFQLIIPKLHEILYRRLDSNLSFQILLKLLTELYISNKINGIYLDNTLISLL